MPISQSAYSRHRGCTKQAVLKALDDGRLRTSIVYVERGGRSIRQLSSAAAADEEWARNTFTRRAKPTLPAGLSTKERIEAEAAIERELTIDKASMQEIRRRLEGERLRKERHRNATLERQAKLDAGELISAKQARVDISMLLASVKLRLRQVPTRVGQRHPGIDHEVLHGISDEIDDALRELADG